jgi:hypothetical protein
MKRSLAVVVVWSRLIKLAYEWQELGPGTADLPSGIDLAIPTSGSRLGPSAMLERLRMHKPKPRVSGDGYGAERLVTSWRRIAYAGIELVWAAIQNSTPELEL